jgi:hypothetical protein
MTRRRGTSDPSGAIAFSPVDNDAPLRWWRRLRIVPSGELGAGRRAVLVALAAWLPIAVWAFATGRFVSADAGEPLFQHYGIHVRCLVAIPLFILAEAVLHRTGGAIAHRFVSSGTVPAELVPRFESVNRSMARLRDASLPWVLAFGAAIAVSIVDRPARSDDALSWAFDGGGGLGFGGWWAAYVARPIFVALLLGWLWRIALVTVWMWRVGKLGLSLVPTHPDRTGGIAFVEKLPGAFALVTLALAAVPASRWAHDVVHHGASLASFRLPALAFAVLWTLLLLLPLLALAPALGGAKRRAAPAYAALVGEQGRLVHRRWIAREPVADDELLEAAGIGPVADAAALHGAVKNMRPVPIGTTALIGILTPMAVPFLLLALVRIPLKDLLLALAKVLV